MRRAAMQSSPKIKVVSVHYQRNGSAGVGFYQIKFQMGRGGGKQEFLGWYVPKDLPDGGQAEPEIYGVTNLSNFAESQDGRFFLPALIDATRNYWDGPA